MSSPILELFDLSGKSAVVTGGGSGIGRAIARRLAQAGAGVSVVDIDDAGASVTVKEIRNGGGKATAIHADVRSSTDAARACQGAVSEFGSLDILVNDAGIYPAVQLMDLTEDVWERVMSTNLRGYLFFAQAAAREMIKGGKGGRMVNIASLEAVHPVVMHGHYASSKGGVVMLSKSLALELAPHKINVNAIAPGTVWTPGLEKELRGFYEPAGMTCDQLLQATVYPRVPLGRMGEPDDIAGVALFLVSKAADYVTGELIMVDGGYLLT